MLLALALLLAVPSQVTVTDSSGSLSASVTVAGVSGTKALAVQGVTGGIAFDVSCIAGCSGGTSDVAATAGASEAAVNRSAVTAAVRVRDTTAGAGSQLVVVPGNTTDGMFVKVTNATIAVTQSTSPWVTSTAGTQAAGSATLPNPIVVGGSDYGGTPKVQTAKVDSTGNVYVICASGCTPGGSFADNTAFVAGTTAINVSGGIFNDGLADVTSGNAAAPRITAKRAMHVNLRDTAGVELEGQKAMAGSVPVVIASDQTAITVATHSVTQGTSPWVVSGTVAATQSGAWTISVGGAFTDDTAASAAASEAATTRLAVNAALRLRDTTAGAGSQLVTWPGDTTSGAFVQVKNTVTVTGTVAATQSGTWTVQPGNTANTTAWLVTGTGGTFPVTGTVAVTQSTSPWVISGTVTQGNAGSLGQSWFTQVTDATTGPVAVKAASTAAQAADKSFVVALSPNSPIPTGSNVIGALTANQSVNVAQIAGTTTLVGNGVTGAGSQRVTIASDNTPFAIKIDQTTPGTTNAVAVAQIGATTVLTGNGATGAGSQRVTIASDNTAFTVNAVQSGTWSVTVVPSLASSANNTGTCTSVSTNATVLASFATRKGASIIAKATNTDRVFFKLGATATTSQPPLEPGQAFTIDGAGIYSGQIDAIANSGTQSVCAVEW